MSSGELQQIKVDSIQYRQFHLNKENIDKEAAQRLRQAEAETAVHAQSQPQKPCQKEDKEATEKSLGMPRKGLTLVAPGLRLSLQHSKRRCIHAYKSPNLWLSVTALLGNDYDLPIY